MALEDSAKDCEPMAFDASIIFWTRPVDGGGACCSFAAASSVDSLTDVDVGGDDDDSS